MISFEHAKKIIDALKPLGKEEMDAMSALGRIVAQPVRSLADSPPFDSSLKDGYALKASSINGATKDSPCVLKITEHIFADGGNEREEPIDFGHAARIMTGARIPPGADAVLPQELAVMSRDGLLVSCLADTTTGRNILRQGSDVTKGEKLCPEGSVLSPALLGLLTGANVTKVLVYRVPKVIIIATGNELSESGVKSAQGKIFPSNRATISGWLRYFGMNPEALLCKDDRKELLRLVMQGMDRADVVITSGGVLDGDKDLVISVMEEAGVEFMFKRVRMGPGKGICMGKSKDNDTLVFNLPGGPPSNYVAFIFLALRAILRLCGFSGEFPKIITATSSAFLKGRADWTQFVLSKAHLGAGSFWCEPILEESRLKRIAYANAVTILEEGRKKIAIGDTCQLALLTPDLSLYRGDTNL